MGESIIVRQNNEFEIEILALMPEEHEREHEHEPESAPEFQPVTDIYRLTPYGMLLAGLGSCTAIVLNTYAQYHEVDLRQVELGLTYDRVFAQDCKECEQIDEYRERIDVEIAFTGELTPEEREKLLAISHQCPIHKMLKQGIEVQLRPVEALQEPQ